MKCPKCGSENPGEAKFCGVCGEAINRPAPNYETRSFTSPQPGVSKEMKIGIIIASLIIPLIGIIMGLIYMGDSSNLEKRSVGKTWLIVGFAAVILQCFLIYASEGCGPNYY